jgi:hypothetical protein
MKRFKLPAALHPAGVTGSLSIAIISGVGKCVDCILSVHSREVRIFSDDEFLFLETVRKYFGRTPSLGFPKRLVVPHAWKSRLTSWFESMPTCNASAASQNAGSLVGRYPQPGAGCVLNFEGPVCSCRRTVLQLHSA